MAAGVYIEAASDWGLKRKGHGFS